MLRIIYNGITRSDFVYYLSRILSLKSNRVIVNDISKDHDLFKAVSKDSKDSILEWRNIVYVKDMIEEESALNEDDIYVEYRGLEVIETEFEAEDTYHLIMPDYTYQGTELVKKINPEGKAIYILRDYCSRQITDKDFALACGLDKEEVAGHIELDAKDLAMYQAFTYNGKQSFTNASADMYMALEYVISTVLLIKEKDIRKLIKKANKLK